MKKILFFGIAGLALIGVIWRMYSRRREIPCPTWLAWMVEADNPFTKVNRARTIIELLELQPGMKMLDAGCGPGRLTLPLAETVGSQETVMALDLQEGMLARVREKVQTAGLQNVELVQAGLGDGKLPQSHFDRALLVTVLGEIPNQEAALQEIHAALKPGGILSVTEVILNKALPEMTIFENRLQASTVLNYDYGGQVWYTEDGDTWMVTQPPNSFGIFHTDPNYPDSKKPVTRGIPGLAPCDVSGTDVLYAGCLGSDGNLGGCARMAKLTESGWELLVHVDVDDNDTGTNENGFGDGMDCTMYNGNFNAWSLTCFNHQLYVGIQSLGGARVLYTDTGSAEDGSWFYSGSSTPEP